MQVANTQQVCKNCIKNHSLISKYQKLTHLYEKKQLQLSQNGSSTLSNLKAFNNTLDTPSPQPPCLKIVQIISKIVKNKYNCFYRLPFGKSAKKFVILNLANRMEKSTKVNVFMMLKNIAKEQISQTNNTVIPQILVKGSTQNENSVKQSLFLEALKHPQNIIQQVSKCIQELKVQDGQKKQLLKQTFELRIINKNLIGQNLSLKQNIEQLKRRLGKENDKKIDNLREIQQQRRQREEQIKHLKQTLKAYESTHNVEQKMLENDFASLGRDLQQFEKLNKMLNNDLDKIKGQLSQGSKKLKAELQKNEFLSAKIEQISKINYELMLKASVVQKLQKEYKLLIQKMEKKFKRLNIYEKQLEEKIQNKLSLTTSESNSIQQELKSEIILMYLANLDDQTYELKSDHLFDEQEKNMLSAHKSDYITKKNQIKTTQNKPMDILEISIIPDRRQCENSDWNCLDNTRQNYQQNRQSQGITMRMIELQIENKKQINKVAELKQKFLHIRDILFKLLKSFQLTNDVKAQSRDILRVLFDLFEYSEEERERIFLKKKRLFGLI